MILHPILVYGRGRGIMVGRGVGEKMREKGTNSLI